MPLLEIVMREEKSNGIPSVIETILHYLRTSDALHQPGIFRVAGTKQEIQQLQNIIDTGLVPTFLLQFKQSLIDGDDNNRRGYKLQ